MTGVLNYTARKSRTGWIILAKYQGGEKVIRHFKTKEAAEAFLDGIRHITAPSTVDRGF